MKIKKYLIICAIFIFIAFLSSCGEIDTSKLPPLEIDLGDEIIDDTLDVKNDVIALFNSYNAIRIPQSFYNFKIIDKDINIDEAVTIGSVDTLNKYISDEELLNIYSEEYFKSCALAILPFTYCEGEFDEENPISLYAIYGAIDYIYIIFDTNPKEKASDNLITKYFFVEVDYSKVDVKEYTGYDIEINGQLIERYLCNYMYVVTSDYSSNNYTTYKEMFEREIYNFNFDPNKNYKIKLYKNYDYIGNYESYATIDKTKSKVLFNTLDMFSYMKVDAIECDNYLYDLTIDNDSCRIIDSQYFERWKDDEYVYTGKLIGGSFDFLDTFFISSDYRINTFVRRIYDVANTLTEHCTISLNTLNLMFDFCEHVNTWTPPEDFNKYTLFEQLDLIYRTDDTMSQDMKNSLGEAIELTKEVFKNYYNQDIVIRNRYVLTLDYNLEGIVNEEINIFEDEKFTLPIPDNKDYGFCGWYLEDERIINGKYEFDRDITLVAKWVDASDFEFGYVSISELFSYTYHYGIKKYIGDKTEVTIPYYYRGEAITAIQYNAFEDSNVEVLDLRCNVSILDNSAIANCKTLKKVYLGANLTDIRYYAFKNCTALEEVIMEEGFKNLGYDTFHFCTGLKSITFGKSVENAGLDIFEGCTNLEEIKVEEGNKKYKADGNCLMAGTSLIYGCKTSIIPNYTTIINKYAFYRCSGLKGKLVLPNSVQYIEQAAFGRTGLSEIYIPKGIKRIGTIAFYSETSLNVYISKDAFMNNFEDGWDSRCNVVYTD